MPILGFLIDQGHLTAIFGVRAVGCVIAILLLTRVRFMRGSVVNAAGEKESFLGNLRGGYHYLKDHPSLLLLLVLYLVPFLSNQSITALLPVFSGIFAGGGWGYGLLQMAPGIGSLLATIYLATLGEFQHKGRALLLVGVAGGLAAISLSMAPQIGFALAALVILGGMNTSFITINSTIIQSALPDQVRGRIMSFRELARSLGPTGGLLVGLAATQLGTPLAITAMGLMLILVVSACGRSLERVDSDPSPAVPDIP